jgi:alkanesulfonate monooxygenase SsuD/methylene tetrahydromethanopterin reductase-like flavin-dependent oxidoreductase (luciferase family)
VKGGLLLLPHEPPARLAEVAQLAEATGYDHFWLADERFRRFGQDVLPNARRALGR